MPTVLLLGGIFSVFGFAFVLGWALEGFKGVDYFTATRRMERQHRRLVLQRAAPLVALGLQPYTAIQQATYELERDAREVLNA